MALAKINFKNFSNCILVPLLISLKKYILQNKYCLSFFLYYYYDHSMKENNIDNKGQEIRFRINHSAHFTLNDFLEFHNEIVYRISMYDVEVTLHNFNVLSSNFTKTLKMKGIQL